MLPITFLQIYMSASNKLVSFFKENTIFTIKAPSYYSSLKIEWIAFMKKKKQTIGQCVCICMYV